jgi:hypothetical protein
MKRLTAILLVLVLASLACSLDFNPPPLSLTPAQGAATRTPLILQPTLTFTPIPPTVPPQETATETQIPPTATPVTATLTIDQLRNSTLTIMGSDQILRTVTLKDGLYQEGSDPAQVGYVSIFLGEKIAFGDLNADGLDDAAIIIAESYGGTGVFVSVVAVLNQGGQPNAVATAPIDDRPMINDLSIKNGEIYVDATIHGINDPGCCAALPSTRNYRLIENTLVLSNFTTTISAGAQRVIAIDSPVNGAEISGPFVVKGSVTISPFENNLVYKVFLQGTPDPVAQAGFLVSADGLGGPGSFELPLDFSAAGFKGPIRLEISDVSPADGSYLALNTLYLTLK